MEKRQIVNIINFIRDVEPRAKVDLHKPVLEQIRLMNKHSLRGTFLLQYDALIDPFYTELMKSLSPAQYEIGVWLEIVQPMTEACHIPWTGRFPWDWHTHCGFSVGYTKEQREKLADALFSKFREIFGYYPRVLGSWLYDSHTIRYIADTYGLDALCNCKEQYGTDGYTLWGGYYGQGYYPSRNNVFHPAQSSPEQIHVPVFRMLGSDPVYQYDFGLSLENGADRVQKVVSLEPVYTGCGGGGNPRWVDWFFKENFSGECLSFGYAQAGQENSFGWEKMEKGIAYQFAELEKQQAEGKITVEPLGETGRFYQSRYKTTPASAIVAHTAYDNESINSVWYSGRFYRINLYGENGQMRIRDIHIFSETFSDPYENEVCTENYAVYETLPLVDGNRFSGNGVLAGAYPVYADKSVPSFEKMEFTDLENNTAEVAYGDLKFYLAENKITVTAHSDFVLENRIGKDGNHMPDVLSVSADTLTLQYRGEKYAVKLLCGSFADARTIASAGGKIEITFERGLR